MSLHCVHIGLGAFARAFVIPYLAEADPTLRVTALSMRSATPRDLLAPQGGRYTCVARGADGDRMQDITALERILVLPEDPAAAIAAIADPQTRLVTITITEKGYPRDGDGALDRADPGVARDLENLAAPQSLPGLLAAALIQRARATRAPLTILSCDNLAGNGRITGRLALQMAAHHAPDLAEPLARNSFPDTMVDRITPAAEPADLPALQRAIGWPDAAPVVHEPFRQWVIEDRLAPDFPPELRAGLQRAGVTLAPDLAPWQRAKLWLLNGAHSTLAACGPMRGHATIAQAFEDPALRDLLRHLWAEMDQVLPKPPGFATPPYLDALRARFENPAILHRLAQIAGDSTQKIPQRLIAPLVACHAAGTPSAALERAISGWAAALWPGDPAPDPMAETLAALRRDNPDPQAFALALLTRLAPDLPGPLAARIATDAARIARDPHGPLLTQRLA